MRSLFLLRDPVTGYCSPLLKHQSRPEWNAVGPVLDEIGRDWAQFPDNPEDYRKSAECRASQVAPPFLGANNQKHPQHKDEEVGYPNPPGHRTLTIRHEEAAEGAGVVGALTESDALEAVLLVHDSDRGCEP